MIPKRAPISYPSHDEDLISKIDAKDFGLWSFRFPLVLVRTGRRLPVQALGERRVLVAVTGYPRRGGQSMYVYRLTR